VGIGWIVLLVCVLAGATLFFSVNAIALRIFSRAKLQEAFKEANKEGLEVALVENDEKLILTCSLYRLILNMALMLVLLDVIARLHKNGPQVVDYLLTFIVAVVIFSIFSLAIPHAWAKYAGEKILSRTYWLLTAAAILAWPFLYIFQLYDGFVRRLAGVTETTPEEQQEEKQEEFLTNLEHHRIEGVVDREEQEMIESVLELDETAADEIMTPRTDITAVEVNSDLQAVLDTMSGAGHTRVPVYEENIDKIIGMIYAKDLLTEIGKNLADFELRNKMREAYFVPETNHIAVVLDEYGGTAGIVTLEDIIEELVGEITDEYEETPAEPVKKIDKNTFEADARTYVDDLNDRFELNLPEDEDYDTIGGFVFSHLGYIPKTGECFDYQDLNFTIVSAEARRIKRIKITKSEDQ